MSLEEDLALVASIVTYDATSNTGYSYDMEDVLNIELDRLDDVLSAFKRKAEVTNWQRGCWTLLYLSRLKNAVDNLKKVYHLRGHSYGNTFTLKPHGTSTLYVACKGGSSEIGFKSAIKLNPHFTTLDAFAWGNIQQLYVSGFWRSVVVATELVTDFIEEQYTRLTALPAANAVVSSVDPRNPPKDDKLIQTKGYWTPVIDAPSDSAAYYILSAFLEDCGPSDWIQYVYEDLIPSHPSEYLYCLLKLANHAAIANELRDYYDITPDVLRKAITDLLAAGVRPRGIKTKDGCVLADAVEYKPRITTKYLLRCS